MYRYTHTSSWFYFSKEPLQICISQWQNEKSHLDGDRESSGLMVEALEPINQLQIKALPIINWASQWC